MKTVEIRPPSTGAETANVMKAALAIVVVVAAYIFRPAFGEGSRPGTAVARAGLLPYQRLIADAPAPEQRMFRELREALLEAERIRSQTGHWPDVAMLTAEGIPPFADDPTRAMKYTWTAVRQDWAINYLGVPADPASPAWVLVILEPEPGAPPDPAQDDETHDRLADGTMLHVSVWSIPEGKRRAGFAAMRLPQNDGWTNWLVGANAE